MQKSVFRCPICSGELFDDGHSLVCPARHSFDKSAQGYVHLLPASRMHAKIPGDSREMVAARRRFLEFGAYMPFRDEICRILSESLADKASLLLLDAGCGEGYYTSAALQALKKVCAQPLVCGFDISKYAVKAAASRSRELHLAVASCFDIPLENSAADALLAVFSPIVPEEFARVVKKGGIMLLAVASERHLWGLKQLLYEQPYPNEHRETDYDGFVFEKRVPVRSEIVLTDNQLINDLFAMTPYYWKTPVEGSRRIAEATRLKTELGFDLLLYRRI